MTALIICMNIERCIGLLRVCMSEAGTLLFHEVAKQQ